MYYIISDSAGVYSLGWSKSFSRSDKPFVQLHYVKQLGQLIYPNDDEIVAVLKQLKHYANSELQQALTQTLYCYGGIDT
ncbi:MULTISPECIES: hypothetical protein [Nostoc]|uniref:Uncharacterized protein n=1 Tax=Nostoc paludosum FACHB-159 TaxID=2692908 RepID=A0ABR8KED8_9NOSO|nr:MULTISPECIES: hypothetical protein [Nostoc]MBD2681472.1 hypothetical protein [Nostoc sp. FACHB-857]MBD2737931.1 hypothetical protein [Nostoc paludosum FACHB-159]